MDTNKKDIIGILIPMTSKNQKWQVLGDCDFFNIFLPSFLRTREEEKFEYKFYIGVDSDDDFFTSQLDLFKLRLRPQDKIFVKDFSGNPCGYWNFLLKEAYNDGCDYFQQFGDDIQIISNFWTSYYTDILKNNDGLGVVGGCDFNFWLGRIMNNEIGIVENCMISKRHFEMLGYFFHPKFKTWWSDDWISRTYYNICFTSPEIKFININRVGDHNPNSRYRQNNNDKNYLEDAVSESQKKIYEYIKKNKLITKINKHYFNYLHKKFN